MENSPLLLFPGLRKPGIISLALWAVLHLLAWLREVGGFCRCLYI